MGKKNSALRAVLEEHFEADLVPWILAEMQDNRAKGRPKTKQYSHQALVHALRNGGQLEPHWGCPSFLEKLMAKPELLQPRVQRAEH